MKKTISVAVSVIIAALLLNNCFTGWEGEGTITISFGGDGRAADKMPWPGTENDPFKDIEHKITITGNGSLIEFDVPKGSSNVKHSVPAGKYTVKVVAYLKGMETPLSPNGEPLDYATGAKSNVEVKAGQTTSVSITMKGEGFCKKCDFVEENSPSFISEGLTFQICDDPSHDKEHTLPQKKIMTPADWTAAMKEATGKTCTILLGANISLDPQTLSQNNTNITLKGSGGMREIRLSSQGILFTINSNARLTIEDIVLVGLKENDTDKSLVTVSGNFTMNGNSSITGNTTNGPGAGVYITNSTNGKFTMNDYSKVTGNSSGFNGGGVWVGSTCEFTMNDYSSITNNTADSGGGVYLQGTFKMYDQAKIYGNTADLSGGVYMALGNFEMYGGEIIGRTTGGGNNTAVHAVFINDQSYGSNASIKGGTIKGITGGSANNAFGVYVGNPNLTVSGGTIIGMAGGTVNNAYGLYINSGGKIIKDNTTPNEALIKDKESENKNYWYDNQINGATPLQDWEL
ncbi:MAG: hypothetical protein LBH44_00855 [Treponema sp.]|nr:hypothetical protein [Treponema sp.]